MRLAQPRQEGSRGLPSLLPTVSSPAPFTMSPNHTPMDWPGAAPLSEPVKHPQIPTANQLSSSSVPPPLTQEDGAISGWLLASWCHTSVPSSHSGPGSERGSVSPLPFPKISPPQAQKTTCQLASEGRSLLRVHGSGPGFSGHPPPLSSSHPQGSSQAPHNRTKLSAQFLLRDGYCLHR